MENLVTALQITVIGMGLVFGAILLFWLIMAVLVRLTTVPQAAGEEAGTAESGEATEERDLKRQAAAAAVAAVLALQSTTEPGALPLPPTALVSAWQAVTRAATFKQRGPVR